MTSAALSSARSRLPLFIGVGGLLALLAGAVLLVTGQAASSAVQVGNKGSIDVADTPYAGNPRNDPKVSCQVSVRFFDFVAGTRVTRVVFERPGAGELLTGDAFDLAAPSGGDGLNGDRDYDLSIPVSEADADRSIPVKVTAYVSHDGGSWWKSKVFKCTAPGETTTEPTDDVTTEPTDDVTTEPTDDATTEPTDAESSDVGGVVTEAPTDDQGEVAGVDEDQGVPTVIDAGTSAAAGTTDLWGVALVGGGLALLVAAFGLSVAAARGRG